MTWVWLLLTGQTFNDALNFIPRLTAADDAAFQQILGKAVAGCAFDYGVDVTTDDHILTLSTCTADPNSRLLVVAKLIDGGGVDVAS